MYTCIRCNYETNVRDNMYEHYMQLNRCDPIKSDATLGECIDNYTYIMRQEFKIMQINLNNIKDRIKIYKEILNRRNYEMKKNLI